MNKSKIITYIIVAVLILAGLYWSYRFFNQSSTDSPELISVSAGSSLNFSETKGRDQEFLAVLADVNNIDLQNRSILNDKTFSALKDFGRIIDQRLVGRTNPFAPLGTGSGLAPKGTQTTEEPAVTPVETETDEPSVD